MLDLLAQSTQPTTQPATLSAASATVWIAGIGTLGATAIYAIKKLAGPFGDMCVVLVNTYFRVVRAVEQNKSDTRANSKALVELIDANKQNPITPNVSFEAEKNVQRIVADVPKQE